MLSAALLGLIQGLTEFLPVSSSGHLTLFGHWLGTRDNDVVFELLLHCGTLLATALVFRKPLTLLILGVLKKEKEQTALCLYILVTTLVTGILGKTFEDPLERAFGSPVLVSCMLLVTGLLLFLPKWFSPMGAGTPAGGNGDSEQSSRPLSYTKAVIIGIAQAAAIIPGISRSGSTIVCCLMLGLSRQKSGEYAFLISLPIILAATLVKVPEAVGNPHHFTWIQMGVGSLMAFASGYAALKFLLAFVRNGKLHYFSWYCWAAGLLGLLFFTTV